MIEGEICLLWSRFVAFWDATCCFLVKKRCTKLNEELAQAGLGQDAEFYLGEAQKRLADSTFEDSNEVKAYLKQFVALKTILDGTKCDSDEYYIFWELLGSSSGHRFVGQQEEASLNPIDSIVHYVGSKRAQRCQDKYTEKF